MNDIHNDVLGQTEDALQQKCVFWFNNAHPELRGLLFSVPNGGLRSSKEGKRMKLTGQQPGVSDMIFLHKYNTYLIELKRDEFSMQSSKQKEWQTKTEAQGFTYKIIFTLKDFKALITKIVGL